MKILFTSVGRRVELVQLFKMAAEKVGVDLIIFGADVDDTAPALAFCDERLTVPYISEDDYIPFLKSVCAENKINALIPTIDTDLLTLSQKKNEFGNTLVLVSESEKVSICRDKRLTFEFFNCLGLNSPKVVDCIDDYSSGYPAFVKPKDGSSSKDAFKVHSFEELQTFCNIVPDYIIQPFVEGTEYTVDVLCDFDGNPIFITPRIRLAVRSGEVLKTRIENDESIVLEVMRILDELKPIGPITIQLIKDDNGCNNYIEINPRFGGGAPLSIKAGADSPSAIIKMLLGQSIMYCKYAAEDGVTLSRFDQSIIV